MAVIKCQWKLSVIHLCPERLSISIHPSSCLLQFDNSQSGMYLLTVARLREKGDIKHR